MQPEKMQWVSVYLIILAIAIEHLKKYNKIKKFIIFDFDVHYGNGTAEMYLNDPNVLYISIHQDPSTLFPGSGFIEEIGVDEGEGYNMNIPHASGIFKSRLYVHIRTNFGTCFQ